MNLGRITLAGACIAAAVALSVIGGGRALAKGSGRYDIDGHTGTFKVDECVVEQARGKGRHVQLVGEGGMQVSLSDDKPSRFSRDAQGADIATGSKAGAIRYSASYALKKKGWQSLGESRPGPLLKLGGGRIVADGTFRKFEGGHLAGSVHGHIEADCHALANKAAKRKVGSAAAAGKPTGTVVVGGDTASFKPEICGLMEFDDGSHAFSLEGDAKHVQVMMSESEKANKSVSQLVQITLVHGSSVQTWNLQRTRKKGTWRDGDGHPASGPVLRIHGHHIVAGGVIPKSARKRAGAQWSVKAYCPGITTLTGS